MLYFSFRYELAPVILLKTQVPSFYFLIPFYIQFICTNVYFFFGWSLELQIRLNTLWIRIQPSCCKDVNALLLICNDLS